MRRALVMALLLAGCAHAPATPAQLPPLTPPKTQRDQQADYAASLFMESCVAHITRPGDLTGWIQQHGLRRMESEIETKMLEGEQGEIWSAASSTGNFLLIVVPINASMKQCSVWVQHANVERLNEHFERMLRGTERPGVELERVTDGSVPGPGGSYRQLVYYLRKEGAQLGWVFVANTNPSEQAEIQARLLVAPGKGRQVLAPGSPETLTPPAGPP